MMTSKQYQIETPEWIWSTWTRVIDNRSKYSRYNDRVVVCLAQDLKRFDEADLVDLKERDRDRIDEILADATPADAIPELDRAGPATAPREDSADTEGCGGASLPAKPRGESE